MISVSEHEHDPIQAIESPPAIKLFKKNDPVNFRLIKDREDIMELLNEKKRQGVDISEYITNLIRRAEGLPIPNRGYTEAVAPPVSQPSGQMTLNPDQMNEIIAKITANLMSSGSFNQTTAVNQDISTENNIVDEEKKQQLQSAVKNMLEWDD